MPGGWSDPTQFSTAVIPPWTVAQFPWLQAGLLTLGGLLLLVIPARLLAGTVSKYRLPADPIVIWLAAVALAEGGRRTLTVALRRARS